MMLGLGGLAAGAGALVGTGAVDVAAERSATVDVAGDSSASAMVQLRSANATYAIEGSSGELGLLFDTTNSNALNPSSTTVVSPVVAITNTGSNAIYVEIAQGSLGASLADLAFYFDASIHNVASPDTYNRITPTSTSGYTTPSTSGFVDGSTDYTLPDGTTTSTSVPGFGSLSTSGYLEILSGDTFVVSAVVVTKDGASLPVDGEESTFTVEVFDAAADLTDSSTDLVGQA